MAAESLLISLEDAKLDPQGVLTVAGWAAGTLPIEAVEVSVGAAVLGVAEYGRERPDVLRDHPDFVDAAKSGFYLLSRLSDHLLSAEEAAVTVRANGLARTASTRITRAAAAETPPSREGQLLFHCDVLRLSEDGVIRLAGWAADRDGLKSIEVSLDGVSVGEIRPGLPRPDVAADHPDIPLARTSGFDFRGKVARIEPGEHAVGLTFVTASGRKSARELSAATQDAPVQTLREELQMTVDSPAIGDGAFLHPVGRMLSIEGWATARAGVAAIDVFIDDAFVTSAIRGIRRLDIATAFPDWPESLQAGFAVQLPRKLFARERHGLRIVVRDEEGATKEFRTQVVVDQADPEAEIGALRTRLTQAEIDLKTTLIAESKTRAAFTVFVAAGDDALSELERTLLSLREQVFLEFDTVFLAASQRTAELATRLAGVLGLPLHVARVDKDKHAAIAVEYTSKLWRQRGREPYLLCLRAGDRLGADALLEFALEIASRPGEELVYADDRRFDPSRGRTAPFFKPEWSPDLLWSMNYIGRLWCASAALVERAGGRLSYWLEHGDFDWLLRLTEAANQIARTPLVLGEVSAKGDDGERERDALAAAMARRGVAGDVRPCGAPSVYRAQRRLGTQGLVSIIIPTAGGRGLIEPCLESIRKHTRYPHYEIVCIDNIRDPKSPWKSWIAAHADRVVECLEPFNWSRLNNLGAKAARGEFLLFLNDDVEIADPHWLQSLLSHAERNEVGVVGPRLLYPDGRVQHGGMFLVERDARHAFRFAEENEPGPFGLAAAERNVAAVTGACMLMRRDAFEAVGCFDEGHAVVNNDVDLCLRMWRAGKRVVYTPHAKLIHHEMSSRGELEDAFDATGFEATWRDAFALGDPFFHPRLSREETDFSPDLEPTRALSAGRPLLARGAVRRILVQKLDHVGDFITGLPAIQRLKQRFPKAEIHVLAPAASAALARFEPAIDNFIEFNFFHSVSQRGRLDISEAEWSALEAKLASLRFDIAVDLRKHAETRDVLKRSGARLMAGFDVRGAFPWLDVALEWDGDLPYLSKRAQVSDDYVSLVEAISVACEEERQFISSPPLDEASRTLRGSTALVGLRPGLFDRPVVCVHPAAGNVLRQWPAEFFAQLIELISGTFDVNFAIVGAPNEVELADEVRSQLRSTERIWSLVGKTKMSDLLLVLRVARLFVGNNSGPHHLAAGMGTPTVGVHSGVVSAREWGPLGPKAVALQRDMSCGPCYLDSPSLCPRSLACLRDLRPADVFRVCEQMLGASLRYQMN